MSFGGSGFGGFGQQQNTTQPSAFGGFGSSTTNTGSGKYTLIPTLPGPCLALGLTCEKKANDYR